MMEGWQDREKEGLPRLIEAMHGHFWSSMERVAKPTSMLVIIANHLLIFCTESYNYNTCNYNSCNTIELGANSIASEGLVDSDANLPPPPPEPVTLAPPTPTSVPLMSQIVNSSDAAVVKPEPVVVMDSNDPDLEGVGEQFTEIIAEVLYCTTQYFTTIICKLCIHTVIIPHHLLIYYSYTCTLSGPETP